VNIVVTEHDMPPPKPDISHKPTIMNQEVMEIIYSPSNYVRGVNHQRFTWHISRADRHIGRKNI